MKNPIQYYKLEQMRSIVDTNNPKNLLLLTFSEIVSNLKKIDYAIEYSNLEDKHKLINKTNDIIEIGLIAALNKKVSETLVDSLLNFYLDSIKRLTYINLTNNRDLLSKLVMDFSELKICFEKCE